MVPNVIYHTSNCFGIIFFQWFFYIRIRNCACNNGVNITSLLLHLSRLFGCIFKLRLIFFFGFCRLKQAQAQLPYIGEHELYDILLMICIFQQKKKSMPFAIVLYLPDKILISNNCLFAKSFFLFLFYVLKWQSDPICSFDVRLLYDWALDVHFA